MTNRVGDKWEHNHSHVKATQTSVKSIFLSRAGVVCLLFVFIVAGLGYHYAAANNALSDYGCDAAPNTLPVLRYGSTGQCVKYVQALLNTDQHAGLSIDGVFGNETQSTVYIFQKRYNIQQDGVIDPQTWSALIAAY